MKTLNTRFDFIAIAVLALVVASVSLVSRVRALPLCPSCQNLRFSFGMVVITAGQTARLSVVNALPIGPPQLPVGPPSIPSGPTAHLDLMFVDASGNPFTVGGAVSHTTVALGPGQSAYFDLNGELSRTAHPLFPAGHPFASRFAP